MKSDTQNHRLPTEVVPSHYQIELAPDLEAARFAGTVTITVEITEATKSIICNAAELSVSEAYFTLVDNLSTGPTSATREELAFTTDPANERLILTRKPSNTHQPTDSGATRSFQPGRGKLQIAFSGILNDQLRGFYRSTFTDDNNETQTLAVTQFEATNARRAFPCWDEPAIKATFAVSLVVNNELMAISNCAETSREPVGPSKTRVNFATTMKMSTYLVAFVVGPLEATQPIDVAGIPVRVVHRPGRNSQTAFALEVTAHALKWYTDYYGIDYPSDKLDLVSIPDFQFGAMENLGCVTFREVLLLVDPDTATPSELQRLAQVINHELAHMWFGDLVTMAWWDDLWLNEAFATFMETACTDAFKPEWKSWSTFGVSRAQALQIDALASTRPIEYPVMTPEDAEDMFDVLTYQKGAALLRMLEQYLGSENFKAGVRLYLNRHAYSNTRDSDLWNALEEATDQPIKAIMDSWITQGGYPLVKAQTSEHGITLTQQHFTLNPEYSDDRTWQIPVRLLTRNGDPINNECEHRVLLDRPKLTLTMQPGTIITVNAGASGFFCAYPNPDTLAAVAQESAQAWSSNSDERFSLVSDSWELTLSGHLDVEAFLEFVLKGFVDEFDLNVWEILASVLKHLQRVLNGHNSAAQRFSELITAITANVLDTLTLELRPGDDDRTRDLRALMVLLRGVVAKHAETIKKSRGWLQHSDPDMAAAALQITAVNGNSDDFRQFWQHFKEASDPQSEQRHLTALAHFPDPDLVLNLLNSTLNGTIRSQDGPRVMCHALLNPEVGQHVWAFITSNWNKINTTFSNISVTRMLEGITVLDHPELAADVHQFLAEHSLSSRQVAQHLERLHVNTAFRVRATAQLTQAVLSYPN